MKETARADDLVDGGVTRDPFLGTPAAPQRVHEIVPARPVRLAANLTRALDK